MSEKQDFNKGVNLRQIAEKRRERWMSRKLLTEILEVVRKQRDDANWIIFQVLKNESEKLSYKAKIKMFNWLANAGYDVEKLRPNKTEETNNKIANIQTIHLDLARKMAEENQKLYQQLQEANEVIKQIAENWTGLAGRDWCPAFRYLEKYNITRWDK